MLNLWDGKTLCSTSPFCFSLRRVPINISQHLDRYAVNVTNTGKMDADDVVLGFMRPPGAGENGIPLQTLFGFERVHVKAGHTVSVSLFPSLLEFTQVDNAGKRYALPGQYHFRFGVGAEGWSRTAGMGYAEQRMVVEPAT